MKFGMGCSPNSAYTSSTELRVGSVLPPSPPHSIPKVGSSSLPNLLADELPSFVTPFTSSN